MCRVVLLSMKFVAQYKKVLLGSASSSLFVFTYAFFHSLCRFSTTHFFFFFCSPYLSSRTCTSIFYTVHTGFDMQTQGGQMSNTSGSHLLWTKREVWWWCLNCDIWHDTSHQEVVSYLPGLHTKGCAMWFHATNPLVPHLFSLALEECNL